MGKWDKKEKEDLTGFVLPRRDLGSESQLRAYFAGLAMQAMVATKTTPSIIARQAFIIADEMMAAMNPPVEVEKDGS